MKQLLKDLSFIFPRKEIWKFWVLLTLIIFGSFAEAVGVATIPLFVAFLIDPSQLVETPWIGQMFKGLPEQPNLKLTVWAACLLMGVMVFKGGFQAFVWYVYARIINHQRIKLQSRMFNAYQKSPYDWQLQRSSSEILRNIQADTDQVIIGVLTPLMDLVMAISMSLFVIFVIVMGTPSSAMLGVLIIGVGLFVTLKLFQKVLKKTGEVLRVENMAMIQAIQQGFGAIVDSRIIGCEAYLAGVFDDSARKQARANITKQIIIRSSPLIIEALAILGLLVILVLLIREADQIADVIPPLSLLGVAVVRLKSQAAGVARAVNTINSAKPYVSGLVKDIQELNQLESIKKSKTRAISKSARGMARFENLDVRDISYRYPGATELAISNVSLRVQRGESIALVGETGCGKSTLVNLILGLLESEAGDIEVNGGSIFSHMCAWREQLGYIPQSVFLIDDSLRANIAFGVGPGEVNQTQLNMAIEAACLKDYISSLSDGLDTIVGERGVRLSGGQRQRLGIARALYFNPEVLVMDEATSALDNQTESLVMNAVENAREGRTLIMIAHRLTTVKNCDRLYYLNNGQLVAYGSYSELREGVVEFNMMAEVS